MNQFDRMRWKLKLQILPRRLLCLFGHKWDTPDAVIIDGPIGVPARERQWDVLGFHQQCDRCYVIRDVEFTEDQALAAIEAEIQAEEAEA